MSAASLCLNVKELAQMIADQRSGTRSIVALVGAPGSGKSTVAEPLKNLLLQAYQCHTTIVPMDGFHYDDAVLEDLGSKARKGAADTFDVGGLEMTLNRIACTFRTDDIAVPVFDRSLELSRASARLISRATEVVIVEGNYLLLNLPPWDRLHRFFDLTVMIQCEEKVLRERLLSRWSQFEVEQAEAIRKVEENDLPNGRLVRAHSIDAQVLLNSA